MTFSKFISGGALVFMVSLASACSANSAEIAMKKTIQSNKYQKPGASVTYSYDLKSQFFASETVTFKLTLSESYKEGQLAVNLSTDGDIVLFPTSTQANFDMAIGTSHEMNISFTANANGRHYINVSALAVSPSGQSQPRIFSIPVQVGPVTAQKPNPNMKTMPDGENIIEMEAQEEIK